LIAEHLTSKIPPLEARPDESVGRGFGEATNKNPGFLAGILYVDLLSSVFNSQQKHSRLHSKIKEAKIKTEKCICCCHV